MNMLFLLLLYVKPLHNTEMQNLSDNVSIIMPAHNEENQLRAAVSETVKVMESIGGSYEIIIIDDHSTDNTGLIAADLATEYRRVHAYNNTGSNGKGSALQYGFSQSIGNYIMFLDADLDLHPCRIPTFFSIMNEMNADVVVGSKQHPESNISYPSSDTYYMLCARFGTSRTRKTSQIYPCRITN